MARSRTATLRDLDEAATALLERDLSLLSVEEVREVATDAWPARAPKRPAKELLGGS